jgi:hypothetical protein
MVSGSSVLCFGYTLANQFVYSAIFQAGGLIVVVVEVTRKSFLASLVPVIVDTILGEHQVVADIVAFVSHGDFPRSRLGEKQRGKVLASWVTRKLRTVAQFSIRDLDEDHPFNLMQPRASRSSKPGSTMGHSIRQSSIIPDADVPVVPRSPATAVPEDRAVTLQESYRDMAPVTLPELDTRTENFVSSTPVPAPTSAVPHIQEPQSATIVTEDDDHFDHHFDDPHFDDHRFDMVDGSNEPGPGPSRDFRFSFDMINSPVEQLPHDPVQPRAEYRPTRQSSLAGGQQPGYHGDGAGYAVHSHQQRPGTQESGLIDDWPQEALMYQSALGGEDGHRKPSDAGNRI